MAYSKQTWDTTSIFNPTRMNHIEDGIESASTATGTEYSSGVSVKDKIDTKAEIKTKTVTVTTNSSGIASLNTTDSQEHILSIYVSDRLAIHFWVGSGHTNWIKVLKWDTLTPTEETVSATYSYT